MATLSFSSAFLALHKPNLSLFIPSSSPALPCRTLRLRSSGAVASSSTRCWTVTATPNKRWGVRRLRSAEEETVAPEQDEEGPASSPQGEAEGEAASSSEQQAVSVPVSPSDTLTMFFQVLRFFISFLVSVNFDVESCFFFIYLFLTRGIQAKAFNSFSSTRFGI